MITIIIFLVLTAVEFILIWFKWNEIQDFHAVGDIATNALGVNQQYKGAIGWFASKLIKMKRFMWIPILLLLILNLLVSIVSTLAWYGLKYLYLLVYNG